MTFALVGNQNCGKTTLFNALTGSNCHVGNFPGVTIEQKSGFINNYKNCSVVDLPGIYSIRPYSAEEIVTRDFILNEKPDAIINIVDATNIERNLYLTLQILELRVPTVLALNMMDEVRGNGGSIDITRMSELLGITVIPISAAKGEGISDLIKAVVNAASQKTRPAVTELCSPGPVHRCIHSVAHVIEDHAQKLGIPSRFAAIKLIEGDDLNFITRLALSQNEVELIEHSVIEMENERGLDRNAALADMRYDFITKVCEASVIKGSESKERKFSEKLDKILTGKFTAIPIFIAIMAMVFWLTFSIIGGFFSELLSTGIDSLGNIVGKALSGYNLNPVFQSLVTDGIFAGVGAVVSFLPIILVLFFFLSILEDTGYMTRVAFFMDKLLRHIGLSGRSFVPMIIGFGCSVPAVMATRTLSSERDRHMTVLLIPFMSCSAKIPIYAIFCAAFFPAHSALAMTLLYIIGMVIGIVIALILNKTAYRGKPVPFVMELPNYRLPSFKSVLLLLREKANDFLQRAFTVILYATLIIWCLSSFDTKLNFITDSSNSLLAFFGRAITPVFKPLGFSDWRIVSSLIAGFSAKEAVVGTLSVLSSSGLSELNTVLPGMFNGLSAVSFLIFTLLYTPCIAAVNAIKRELGSGWKALGVVISQCVIAWICSFAVYNIGSMLL
ncbi:MAG: ferrous iron transport protein B [Oscillospiraceae bacterium]|nr:ferrous iron transport protein B [Oscillospiraceae bacterium]